MQNSVAPSTFHLHFRMSLTVLLEMDFQYAFLGPAPHSDGCVVVLLSTDSTMGCNSQGNNNKTTRTTITTTQPKQRNNKINNNHITTETMKQQ